jgi:hypothetical protein
MNGAARDRFDALFDIESFRLWQRGRLSRAEDGAGRYDHKGKFFHAAILSLFGSPGAVFSSSFTASCYLHLSLSGSSCETALFVEIFRHLAENSVEDFMREVHGLFNSLPRRNHNI